MTAEAVRSGPTEQGDEGMAKKTNGSEGTRRREQGGKRLAVYLPEATIKRLRMQCVKDDCSVSDAVTRAVDSWLGERIGR